MPKNSYLTVTDELLCRIMARVNKDGPIPTDPSRLLDTGCWLWTGGCFPAGYGSISVNDQTYLVHVLVYRGMVGDIPDNHDIDHVCRVRNCCRPDHIEAVTRAENIHRAQRPTCKKGHPYTPDNTGFVKGKPYQRVCRICSAEKMRRWRERQKSHES